MRIQDAIALLKAEAQRQGVPEDVALEAFGRENFKGGVIPADGDMPTDRVSHKKAQGIMQVIPTTWEALVAQGKVPASASPMDPAANIQAGIAVLAERMAARKGNKKAALADYNGGISQGDLVMAGKEPSYQETRNYVSGSGASPMTNPNESGSTSVSYKALDPAVVLGSLNDVIAGRKSLAALLDASVGKQVGSTEAIVANLTKAADASATIATATGEAEIAQSRQNQSIVKTLGGGMDRDSVYMQAQVGVEEARKTQDALREQITAMDSVSIFDSPLDWLVNQFKLPTMKTQYNAAAMKEEALLARQAQIAQKIEQAEKVNPAVVEKQIQERVNAQRTLAAADAAVKAATAVSQSQQDISRNLHNKLAILNADYHDTQAVTQLLAENRRITAAYAKESAADRRALEALGPINMQREAVGLQPYTPDQFLGLDPKSRATMIADSMNPLHKRSPGEVLSWFLDSGAISTIGNANPAVAQFIREQLTLPEVEQRGKAIKQALDVKGVMLPRERIDQQAFNELAEAQIKEYLAPRSSGKSPDMTNLPPQHFAQIRFEEALRNPALAGNPMLQMIKDQQGVSKGVITAAEMKTRIEAKVMAADPKDLPQLAQELSKFYQTAQQHRWENGPAQFGFPKPSGYGLDIFGGKRKVNMASPADLEAAMTAYKVTHDISRAALNPANWSNE